VVILKLINIRNLLGRYRPWCSNETNPRFRITATSKYDLWNP